MKKKVLKRGLVILALVLSGCGITPGIQMGVISQRAAQDDSADAEAFLKSADIFPLDTPTIQRLDDEAAENARKHPKAVMSPGPSYQYVIGPQDVLRITVWDHPELNNPGAITGSTSGVLSGVASASTTILGTASTDSSSRTVSDNGTIFYPYVGVVAVADKTTDDVRAFLSSRLAKSIRDPQVEVVIASFRSKRAYVTGDVKAPGILPITDVPLTVADAVAASGGANPDANLSGATLNHGGTAVPVDLYAMLYQGDISQNLAVSAGDILNIPEQRFNKVFVLGEVVKPSSIPLPRGNYSLNEALSDSGGVNQMTAQASQIYVIRSVGARAQIFHLDARRASSLVIADQFLLQPRDIVFVDAAEIVRYNRVISQILPALQALQAGKYLGQ